MLRAIVSAAPGAAVLATLLAVSAFSVLAPASATTPPIASQDEMESMARPVDYRRCYWADGHRLCRTYYLDESSDQASAAPAPDYGYYGAPGIYLGYSGLGGGAGRSGILEDSTGE
jgi:hypothetical protein